MIIPIRSIDLTKYSESDLQQLKSRIEDLLPGDNLQDIDLEQELIRQFRNISKLLNDTLRDNETPLNHIAAIQNACTSMLKQIADAQQKLSGVKTVQMIENVLADLLTEEQFTIYAERLTKQSS